MPYTLQQLSDFEDIRTLKHRYFRCIDTANLAELQELFTDDVEVDYRGGTYRVALRGREAMIDFIANVFTADALARHSGQMPELHLTGPDTAEGTWYLDDLFVSLTRKDWTIGTALYRDRYVRTPSGWRIARTEYDRLTEITEPLRAESRVLAHYLGRHGRMAADCTDVSRYITWTAPA